MRKLLAGLVVAIAFGGVMSVSTLAEAHTLKDSLTCTSWSIDATNYQSNQHNTYSYSVDGSAPVVGSFKSHYSDSGTFPANSGNHTLVGYVYQNDQPKARYSFTFDLSTKDCLTAIPIPAAPTVTPPTCLIDGVLNLPANTDLITWTSTGTGPGDQVITATATQGNVFTDGNTVETYTVTVLPKGSGLDCSTPTPPTTPPPPSTTPPVKPPVHSTTPVRVAVPVPTHSSSVPPVPVQLVAAPTRPNPSLASTGASPWIPLMLGLFFIAMGAGAIQTVRKRSAR